MRIAEQTRIEIIHGSHFKMDNIISLHFITRYRSGYTIITKNNVTHVKTGYRLYI